MNRRLKSLAAKGLGSVPGCVPSCMPGQKPGWKLGQQARAVP